MNLLQRSIGGQGHSSSSATSSAKKSTFNTNSTNTHVLFHLNDPYASYTSSPPSPSSQFFAAPGSGRPGKGKSAKSSSGFQEYNSGHSNANNNSSGGSSFDYYEYFSNYGRVLATPPASPHPLDNGAFGAGIGGDHSSPREGGFKRFWRRNSPAKFQTISLNNSSERPGVERGRDPYQASHGIDSSPRTIQRYPSAPGKSSYRLSPSPSSPGLGYGSDGMGPLMSSPRDHYGGMSPMMGLRGDIPFRISFIETNLYIPIDLPQSPDNIGPRPFRHHQFLHQEWVAHTVAQLKAQFKSTQILINVERKARYPFVIYGSPGPSFDPNAGPVVPTASCNALSPELRIFEGLYDICASISRPGSNRMEEDPSKPVGYIICAFQTFPGEDSEKLERNWLVWTGKSNEMCATITFSKLHT